MHPYSSVCDDFYINMNLSTEMELPTSRETILHYFERVQKKYPTMRNFYCREKGDFVLEEDKDSGNYRWTTIEARRLCSGQVNPETLEEALVIAKSYPCLQYDITIEVRPVLTECPSFERARQRLGLVAAVA